MSANFHKLEQGLESSNKDVRLRSIKLILTHPDADTLQIVRCLASPDNQNFEFMEVFGLDSAMRSARDRLCESNDPRAIAFLRELHAEDPIGNSNLVAHILDCIRTPQALKLLYSYRDRATGTRQYWIEDAIKVVKHHLENSARKQDAATDG